MKHHSIGYFPIHVETNDDGFLARCHDLDGAFAGKPKNAEIIHEIASAYPDLKIQLGGGIRDEDTVAAYLDAGVDYLIGDTLTVNLGVVPSADYRVAAVAVSSGDPEPVFQVQFVAV